MKIYTRTGDKGATGLIGGVRVSKSNPTILACGDVDETNCHLGCAVGLASGETQLEGLRSRLVQIQSDLFDLGSHVASSCNENSENVSIPVTDEHIAALESWIDLFQGQLEPLKTFVLPGGSQLAGQLHLARAVCRRAERSLVSLIESEPVADLSQDLIYLNRLGDLLFVMARSANQLVGQQETPWLGKSG